jgi:DNA processing protein
MAGTLESLGAEVLDIRQPDYPDSLRRLPQPPAVLFVLGRRAVLDHPAIAVVGTRAHSAYGRDATVSLVVGLVRAGYAVVSGLARGIDGVGHRTALEMGGDTIAVLGNGLDVVYPPEHGDLRAAIAHRGCLVTEFAPTRPPRRHHFPQRNRIIAGLARAVLVVEATERSGALITAHYAMEDGKEVFAVPGPIHNPGSRGPHRLIQDGAALVTSAADLLQVLQSRSDEPAPAAATRSDDSASAKPADPHPDASALARRIWRRLAAGPRDLEELGTDLGARPEALSAALLELELAGLVERLPGPRYGRCLATRARRAL